MRTLQYLISSIVISLLLSSSIAATKTGAHNVSDKIHGLQQDVEISGPVQGVHQPLVKGPVPKNNPGTDISVPQMSPQELKALIKSIN